MKKFSSFLFAALVISFATNFISCSSTRSVSAQNQVYQPLENALLWKITGKGLKQPSYLFGTIHIIGAEDYFLPNGILSAIERTDKMYFEIDVKDMTDISAMMGMMGKIFMKDGQSLKDLLSDDEYTLVSNHFQKIGIPMFMLERMKPMFLTVFAYGDFDPDGLQKGSVKSYEMELYEMAKNAGKATAGLESVDYQIGLFDKIPYEAQAKMLVEAIRTSNVNDDSFKRMTQMYVSQNVEEMVSMISEEGSEISGFEDDLLHQRNKNWIPLIKEAVMQQPSFFAVGAGHLAGKEGVIHLLRKEGYDVRPVK